MSVFRVIDLKQYSYCARLIYYHHCLPHIRPVTYKMQAGIDEQDSEAYREARRSLKLYNLNRGERWTDVQLSSEQLGLRGKVDLVIKTDDNAKKITELIPVDYKFSATAQAGKHLKLQLTAYGLMLAEAHQLPVTRGFLYYISQKQAIEVKFTPQLKKELHESLAEMKQIVLAERMPEQTPQAGKCIDCEFRRFCNDI